MPVKCTVLCASPQGSTVLEHGHLVVLGWGKSQTDIRKLEIILSQLCAAYRGQGGRTIAVLTMVGRLEWWW